MTGKRCQSCRWCEVQPSLFGEADDARCGHPRLERPPAEPGLPERHPTLDEARARGPGMCGPEARLHEPKPRQRAKRTAA